LIYLLGTGAVGMVTVGLVRVLGGTFSRTAAVFLMHEIRQRPSARLAQWLFPCIRFRDGRRVEPPAVVGGVPVLVPRREDAGAHTAPILDAAQARLLYPLGLRTGF